MKADPGPWYPASNLAHRGVHCPTHASVHAEGEGQEEAAEKRERLIADSSDACGLYAEKCTQALGALEASGKDTSNPAFFPEWAKC